VGRNCAADKNKTEIEEKNNCFFVISVPVQLYEMRKMQSGRSLETNLINVLKTDFYQVINKSIN
jgi:hypothetical protein